MAFKMKGPSLLKMTSALKQVHTHPGAVKEHNPMDEHDPPLHQHLVGAGNRQPKKGLAKLIAKINPWSDRNKSKRRRSKRGKNIVKHMNKNW